MRCPSCQKNLETVSIFHLRDCLSGQTTLDGAEKVAAIFNEMIIEAKHLSRRQDRATTLEAAS